jgi:tetratricopeptide (TPR) repeat protein
VLHLAALIERRRGNLPAARDILERLVAGTADRAEIRNTLGNLLTDLGDLDGAERHFAAANAREPNYAPAWINRGQLATRRGDLSSAVSYLERAAALQPRSALAQTGLAQAYRKQGEFVKAEQAARRAVALAPGQANPRLALGLALRGADRQEEAIAEYRAAEAAGIRNPGLLEALGGAWFEAGDTSQALLAYDRLTREFPAYLRGHRERARLHFEGAIEGDPFSTFQALAQAYPRDAAIWQEWLGALIAYRQFEQAADVAAQAERAIGPSPLLRRARAVALSGSGRLDEADPLYVGLVDAFRGDLSFLESFAHHLLARHEPDRAAAAAEEALALDPDAQMAWALLGTAWRLMGDAREHWLYDYERHATLIEAAPASRDEDPEGFARAAAPVLRRLHITRAHPPDQSLRGGTQTPGALFDRAEPEIRAIREAVEQAARRFVAALPDDPAHPFLRRKGEGVRFTGSWSVRLTSQGFHVNHVHSQGWLSSAYYFVLPEHEVAAGENEGWLQLGQPPSDLGLDLPPRRLIQPRVGTIALFPSFMWHGTIPFASGGERLTCAFDMLPESS